MAETAKFTALGMGNGFPFIPNKKNVLDRGDGSEYAYWTTLGGYNADSASPPSDAEIGLSFDNAMKLYWNLDYASIAVSAATNVGDSVSFSGNIYNGDTDIDSESPEPRFRVCGLGESTIEETDVDAEYLVQLSTNIARYYKGDVSDEDNFVGYGLYFTEPSAGTPVNPGLQDILYYSDAVTETGECNYDLGGTWDGRQDGVDADREISIGYTTLNGIPLVWWSSGTGPSSESPSITTGYGGATYSDDNGDSSTSLSSLNFYTYAP